MLHRGTGDGLKQSQITGYPEKMSMICRHRNKRIHIIYHSHPFPGSHFGQCNHNNKRFDFGLIVVRASRRHGCQAYYFAERRLSHDDFLESHCYSNTIIRRECFSSLSRPVSS